jgi:hypothetical protein
MQYNTEQMIRNYGLLIGGALMSFVETETGNWETGGNWKLERSHPQRSLRIRPPQGDEWIRGTVRIDELENWVKVADGSVPLIKLAID